MTADEPSNPASPVRRAVIAHYGGDVEARVHAALAAAGVVRPADPAMLAAMDQLHPRGMLATDGQARRAALFAGARVLDLGGGLGGPARWLARHHAAVVTVLDLTPAFCRLCRHLTALCELGEQVRAVCGDAAATPFAAACFDRVWVQYSLMNLPDKPAVFAEAFRVLAPGGRMVIGDLAAGDGQALRFPVPWGTVPGTTFLETPDTLRTTLEAAGFVIDRCEDETEATLGWWRGLQQRQASRQSAPSPLGPQVAFGQDTRQKVANLMRNLEDGRIREVLVVASRPA